MKLPVIYYHKATNLDLPPSIPFYIPSSLMLLPICQMCFKSSALSYKPYLLSLLALCFCCTIFYILIKNILKVFFFFFNIHSLYYIFYIYVTQDISSSLSRAQASQKFGHLCYKPTFFRKIRVKATPFLTFLMFKLFRLITTSQIFEIVQKKT